MKRFSLSRLGSVAVPIAAAAIYLLAAAPDRFTQIKTGWSAAVATAHAQTAKAPKIALEKVFKIPAGPYSVAWSPDGKLLVTSEDMEKQIVIWDYATQRALHTIYRSWLGLWWLTFAPDGRYVITATLQPEPRSSQNRIAFSFIDAVTGKVVRNVDGPHKNTDHITQNMARKFAMSLVSKRAAIITADNYNNNVSNYVSFYDTDSWSLLSTHKLEGSEAGKFLAVDIAANPANGQFAILGVGGELEIWDAVADRAILRFQTFAYGGGKLAFSPAGEFLVVSETQAMSGMPVDPDAIRMWETGSWKMVAAVAPAPGRDWRSNSIALSPDGKYLASLNLDAKVRLWDAKSLTFITEVDDGGERGGALSFAPDSRRLAILRNWDVRVVTIGNPD